MPEEQREGGVAELVKEHPAVVLGGVLLVGVVILTSRKPSTPGALGPAASSTAVSADTLNNALAKEREDYQHLLSDQRQELEDQIAQYYNEHNEWPPFPIPSPEPTPGPGPPAPNYCPIGQHRSETGQCVPDDIGIPIHRIYRGGGYDPYPIPAPGDRQLAYEAHVRAGTYGI